MSNKLTILLNRIAQLEYHRDRPLPEHQALHLDNMDQKMDQGILLGDTTIDNPDINQRAQFVAANLVHAIKNDQEANAAAMCTWLANRLPELKQVKIEEQGNEVSINLVFDEEHGGQMPVQFIH